MALNSVRFYIFFRRPRIFLTATGFCTVLAIKLAAFCHSFGRKYTPVMLINRLYRFIAAGLAPAGKDARLSILIYHRVLEQPDVLFPHEVTQANFDAQMACLKAVFNVLPLSEAVARWQNGTLPARAACITFDDGYADNVELALPILQRHGLTATFFIATAYLDGGRMFNDTVIEAVRSSALARVDLRAIGLGEYELSSPEMRALAIDRILSQVKTLPLVEREAKVARLQERLECGALPDDLMMSSEQVRTLFAAGMEIGAHTAQHPILAGMAAAEVRQEIQAGREFLETLLGAPVRLFAYPNGKPGVDYLPEQRNLVEEMGFVAAVSTQRGVTWQHSDRFQLPRFTPWQSDLRYFIPALLKNLHHCRRLDAGDRRQFEPRRKRLRRES